MSIGGAFSIIGGQPNGLFKSKAGGGAPPFVGLLDLYPNAAAAYSLRKLRDAYTGSAVRIRRSSDNAESDIGFVNNEFDTAAAQAFCGAGNGFITTWYDQAIGSNNAIQSTAANQPQIIVSGSLVLFENKYGISFDGAGDILNITNLDSTPLESIFIANTPGSNVAGAIANATSVYLAISSVDVRYRTQFLNTLQTVTTDLGGALNSFNRSSNVITAYRNTIASSTTLTGDAIPGISHIGSRPGSSGILGTISEIILYSSDQTANLSGISNNINSYYGIY
jgi:hypothetical protein